MRTGATQNQSPRRPSDRLRSRRSRHPIGRLVGLAVMVGLVVVATLLVPKLIAGLGGPAGPQTVAAPSTPEPTVLHPTIPGPATADPATAGPVTAGPEPARRPGLGPPAPTGVTATGGDRAATIAWIAAEGAERPVTGYEVQIVDDPLRVRSAGLATSLHWTGLVGGTPYRFRVRAVNSDGWGPWSERSEAVTPSP